MLTGTVFFNNTIAGTIAENDDGFIFTYLDTYCNEENAQAISLTLPLQNTPYYSKTMFPFFDGLIPEGWILDIAVTTWKINPRDRMKLLLTCCQECIGAVSVKPLEQL